MTIDKFISNIQQELSVACSIPFSIPSEEIERIINISADWFYRNYEDSLEERYFLIPSVAFKTPLFNQKRVVKMPDCVYTIYAIKKLKEDLHSSASLRFDGTGDMGIEKFIFSNSNAGMNSESLMYYTINLSYLDMVSHMITHTISFNYNKNSRNLFIGGEIPNRDCVATCMVKLPIEQLINDEMFYRYVVAKAKIQLSRVIGTFEFNLPGNIRINYDLIREEGQNDLDNIEEEIRNTESLDFFFTSGGQ